MDKLEKRMDMGKFLIKLAGNALILVLFLMMLAEASFVGALLTSVVFSAAGYVLGDRMILPKLGNAVATAADAGLAAVVLWTAATLAPWSLTLAELFILVVLVSAFECLFHFFVQRGAEVDERRARV